MVAGIFAKHGVWCGTSKAGRQWENEPCYENRFVKQHLTRTYGRLDTVSIDADAGAEIPALIARDNYPGGQWFFKCSALYWRAFAELDPTIVTIRRPVESIRRSVERDGLVDRVDDHEAMLDWLEAEKGAARIDSPPLIGGDYTQITEVFERCGLTFLPDVAAGFVKPRLWHS